MVVWKAERQLVKQHENIVAGNAGKYSGAVAKTQDIEKRYGGQDKYGGKERDSGQYSSILKYPTRGSTQDIEKRKEAP